MLIKLTAANIFYIGIFLFDYGSQDMVGLRQNLSQI